MRGSDVKFFSVVSETVLRKGDDLSQEVVRLGVGDVGSICASCYATHYEPLKGIRSSYWWGI